jgi:hypothetical protein
MTSYVDIFGNQTVPPSEAAYIRHTIAANGQLVWPYNFGGDDLLTADITEIDATVGSLVVTLPPATEVSVGQDILIRNVGANAFDIVDFASGAVTTVPTGTSKYLFVTDNSTEAGVWGLFTYGTGTSGADASLLAGEGLQAITNQLHVAAQYRGVNSSQSLTATDRASVIEVVTGSLTLTLPQASVATDGYYVFIRNSSAGSTTVEGFGTEQIDGTLNKVLAPNESAIFVCNGTYWITVGFGRDATFVFSEVVVNAALTNITLSSADVAGRMIRVSGTATGNVTVTLPAVDNIYFVNVETGLGGFNCTFTTGSGATVVMLANQKTVLYCDGTNVSTAITTSVISTLSLNDGSAGAPVVTFALDTDTGFYRSASGAVGFTSNAVNTVTFNSNGIAFTPVGSIAANNVAGALAELDGDITTVSNGLAAHIADAVDAHDASAISNVPAGGIAATDVQTAINELDTEKAPLASPVFTGNPTAPTAAVNDNDTSIATTAFVRNEYGNGFGGGSLNFRNKIINGNFDFWQRGTSQTSSGYGSADRWESLNAGSTKTASRQTFALGQTEVPNNPTYFCRTVVTSVAGAANLVLQTQLIEYVSTLAGKTATLSFYAKADASKNIAVEFFQNFGTGGSPSASISGIGVTTIPLTTTWQKFTVTVSIPSIAGKTLGTNSNDRFECGFWFDAGSSFNARTNSLGQQSGTFDIAQVQLEEGSVATPFEQRPIGLELSLCQRYFLKAAYYWQGNTVSGNGYGSHIAYNTLMRSIPTLVNTNFTVLNGTFTFSSVGAISTNQTGTAFVVASATSTTNGAAFFGGFTADAEL